MQSTTYRGLSLSKQLKKMNSIGRGRGGRKEKEKEIQTVRQSNDAVIECAALGHTLGSRKVKKEEANSDRN